MAKGLLAISQLASVIMDQSLDNLTDKERLFVQHYLTNNYNAGKAAVSAGYSEASRYDTGYKLLRKPEIKAYIDAYMKEASLDKQELLKRLSDVAKNVGSEYVLLDGTVDLESLLNDGYGHLIKEVRRYKNGKIRVLFHDSAKALADLAKIHKLVSDGVNLTVNIDEKILAEQRLTEELTRIHDRMMEDPITRKSIEYAEQLRKEQQNNATEHLSSSDH